MREPEFTQWMRAHGVEHLRERVRLDVVWRAGELLRDSYLKKLEADRAAPYQVKDLRVTGGVEAGEGRAVYRMFALYESGTRFSQKIDFDSKYLGACCDEDLESVRLCFERMLGWWK